MKIKIRIELMKDSEERATEEDSIHEIYIHEVIGDVAPDVYEGLVQIVDGFAFAVGTER